MWTRDAAIAYLNDTFHALRRQDDLSPDNGAVTARLRDLVTTLRDWHRTGFGIDLIDEPALAELRVELPALCALAEREMEKWWSGRIAASASPETELRAFWYFGNYESLCSAETELAGPDNLRNAVFLGCGALPLTAILLARNDNDTHIHCVDADAQACTLAERLIRALGLEARITVLHERAEACAVNPGATVICASLLKAPGLYGHLTACGAARLLVRDVEGVYRWLYRPSPLPGRAFRECARSAPSPERINITRRFEAVRPPESSPGFAAGFANT